MPRSSASGMVAVCAIMPSSPPASAARGSGQVIPFIPLRKATNGTERTASGVTFFS